MSQDSHLNEELAIRRKRLYFTLFEGQLTRSYLSSDDGNLMKAICKKFDVVIITNRQLYDLIRLEIKRCRLDQFITIQIVPMYEDSWLTRVTGSFLRWSDSSPTTTLKIHWNLGDTAFPKIFLLLRILLNLLFSKSKSVAQFMRKLYIKSFRLSTIRTVLNLLEVETQDLLFISSLTNYWEDCVIGASFRSNGNKIIATVRSWDNLVSHGRLRLVPDIFISHSSFMRNCAENIQFFSPEKIVDGVTPTYQSIFLPVQRSKASPVRHIIYASMGLTTNPDDLNFCLLLIQLSQTLTNEVYLTILEHPKFPLGIDLTSLPHNVEIMSFPYESSNIRDYYQMLLDSDLIICGGTTAALDGCFVGAKVALIAFEVEAQSYWQSALRYFDTRLHTKTFFELSSLPVISNEKELMIFLQTEIPIERCNEAAVEYFTGDKTKLFANVLIDTIEKNY